MKYTARPGIALLLVMSIMFVVLTSAVIGAAIILKNLDSTRGNNQSEQARLAAAAGLERVQGLYKANDTFFTGCATGDCIDLTNKNCAVCGAATMTQAGNLRYEVKITNLQASAVSLLSTGYHGAYKTATAASVTLVTCGQSITDRDGYVYPTVQISTQCWMAASLRTKTKPDDTCINGGRSAPCPDASVADNTLGRSCYANEEANCTTDGALYNWSGAMDGSSTEGAQGICPDGWHIPTDGEWYTLELGLTDPNESCDATRTGGGGDCSPAGTSLQSGGSSGFDAVMAGWRVKGNTFEQRENMSTFWTSTGTVDTYKREIHDGSPLTFRAEEDKVTSLSLRCLKNQ